MNRRPPLILFCKADPFVRFGAPSTVSGYVNPKTGKLVAPYTGIRHRKLQKPDHPLSGHLFAQADPSVASRHVQPAPETAKPRKSAAPDKTKQSDEGNGNSDKPTVNGHSASATETDNQGRNLTACAPARPERQAAQSLPGCRPASVLQKKSL